jgi:hypothetical protein
MLGRLVPGNTGRWSLLRLAQENWDRPLLMIRAGPGYLAFTDMGRRLLLLISSRDIEASIVHQIRLALRHALSLILDLCDDPSLTNGVLATSGLCRAGHPLRAGEAESHRRQ